MRFNALSVGKYVPLDDQDARVHSVFSAAAYLKSWSKNVLLALVGADNPDLPNGIRLQPGKTFPFSDLRIGEKVEINSRLINFLESNFKVDFGSASVWNSDLHELNIDLSSPSTLEAWECVYRLVFHRSNADDLHDRFGEIFFGFEQAHLAESRILDRVSDCFKQPLCRLSEDELQAICSLVGVGAGLTPAGDDFLVGLIAGLKASSPHQADRRELISELVDGITARLQKTNDISASFLACAAKGQVSSSLMDVLTCISQGRRSGCTNSFLQPVLKTGHTSGRAAMAGILLGLIAWSVQEPIVEKTDSHVLMD
jgi:hypothetical protein